MSTLRLPIKKQWFEMIAWGVKKEEYREIKPYWKARFVTAGLLLPNGSPSGEGDVIFVNGYDHEAPVLRARVRISIGRGRPEWGAEPGKVYYRLKILSVLPALEEAET